MKKIILATFSGILLLTIAYYFIINGADQEARLNYQQVKNTRPVKSEMMALPGRGQQSNGKQVVSGADSDATNFQRGRVVANIAPPVKNGRWPKSSMDQYFSSAQPVTLNQQEYLVAPELATLPSADHTESMGPSKLVTLGQVFFVPVEDGHGRPALLNLQSRRLAVLTGRINVTPTSRSKLQNLKLPEGVTIDRSMGHLNIYSITYLPQHDLLQAAEQLASHNNIDVELEIVEEIPHVK